MSDGCKEVGQPNVSQDRSDAEKSCFEKKSSPGRIVLRFVKHRRVQSMTSLE